MVMYGPSPGDGDFDFPPPPTQEERIARLLEKLKEVLTDQRGHEPTLEIIIALDVIRRYEEGRDL